MSAPTPSLSSLPYTRRRPLVAVLAVVGSLLVAGAGQAPAAAAPPAGQTKADLTPKPDPAKGLTFDGLRPGAEGTPCAKKYEMVLSSGEVVCTHGPDPAPPEVDVREPAPVPMITEEAATALASSTTCQGDGSSGPRVQLVYARSAGVADRYSSMLPSFREWAARIDDIVNSSAVETGGSRHVRYVHDASCQPTVLKVTLTAAGDDNFVNTIDELRAQGHDRSDRKYLLWVDANVYCGIAQVYTDDRPGQENYNNGPSNIAGMVARVDSGCWGAHTLIEAHELVHTLGSVQPGAPNATAQGHCSDEYDRMCYADAQGVNMRIVCPSTAYENRLDCNGDDYFSTSPAPGSWLATHWNTANSSFLAAGSAATQPRRAQRNDFDGDGKTDVAVYRPAGAQWLIKDGSPGFHQWGTDGDLAVPADYTGDGKVDVATFRPSVGQWFLKDVPSGFVIWGQNGDIPVPADYDGDGKAEIAVFRPTTGGWFVQGVGLALWGAEGDVPVPGDYDGDGDADRAVYRPSTGAWFVHGSLAVTWWGTSGDIPVPGDYDGNGTLDKAVFRPSTGSWLVNGGSAGPTVWGGSQDVPTVVSNTVFGVLGLLDLIV